MKWSIEGSAGVVLSDFRKDARPGVLMLDSVAKDMAVSLRCCQSYSKLQRGLGKYGSQAISRATECAESPGSCSARVCAPRVCLNLVVASFIHSILRPFAAP